MDKKSEIHEIRKLPQELVNQIAAGEVIERPASVVKELLDNSIDARSTEIKISLKKGGLQEIKITDNGIGIAKEMLSKAFDAHSTSKINSLADLNSLMTMGFRGEALSTIIAIAEVKAISKPQDQNRAFEVEFEGINAKEPKEAAHENGTTVIVNNIFEKIPARLKFLSSSDTEYRKVLNILLPYFIIHLNVHFTLEREGKVIYNLPPAKSLEQRIHEIFKSSKGGFTEEMIPLKYDGAGIKISGVVAHPKHHNKRVSHMYSFVNNRPIADKGIFRAVISGFDRFIPHGEKVPFILMLQISPENVDVNVDPKKQEVRFVNPYRVYHAVEQAVNDAIANSFKNENSSYAENSFSNLKGGSSLVNSFLDRPDVDYKQNSRGRVTDISFKRPNEFSVQNSLEFSREILTTQNNISNSQQGSFPEQFTHESYEANLTSKFKNATQLFKKYIVLQHEDEMWTVDQHAAAERITFEKLLNNYNGNPETQRMLVPLSIELESEALLFIKEQREIFERIGFEIEIDEEKNLISISAVPVEFTDANLTELFHELEEVDEEIGLAKNFEKLKENLLATIACHNSIRTNQALDSLECVSLVEQLMRCENPYSCPHGRPIIWKLKLNELDKNFDRTY